MLYCVYAYTDSSWGECKVKAHTHIVIETDDVVEDLWAMQEEEASNSYEDQLEDYWEDHVLEATRGHYELYDPTNREHALCQGVPGLRPEHAIAKIEEKARNLRVLTETIDSVTY